MYSIQAERRDRSDIYVHTLYARNNACTFFRRDEILCIRLEFRQFDEEVLKVSEIRSVSPVISHGMVFEIDNENDGFFKLTLNEKLHRRSNFLEVIKCDL